MLEHGLGQIEDVINRWREAPIEKSTCAYGKHQGLARARARSPGNKLAEFACFGARACRTHKRQNRLDHGFTNRQTPDQALRRQQIFRGHRRLGARLFRAGRIKQNSPLGLLIGIIDIDLHQKAVELGFGQRISAFLFERVLRCKHVERLGQIVAGSRDGHVLLLHGLQKR